MNGDLSESGSPMMNLEGKLMLNGTFHRLPGASEGWNTFSHESLAHEPWLLPISDGAAQAQDTASDAVAQAVAQASRKLWIVANAFCLALALLLAAETATGWMSGSQAVNPIAKVPVVTASAS